MAKKASQDAVSETPEEAKTPAPAEKPVKAEKTAKSEKPAKKNAKSGDKKKKTNWFRALGSELKKVTWPTFGKVVKQTGIVIGVVLFFMVIVGAIDVGLGALYRLLTDQAWSL